MQQRNLGILRRDPSNQALQLTADRPATTLHFFDRVLDIESLGFRQR